MKTRKLEEFREKYKDCKKCTGCLNDTKVYGHGNINSKICVIGEGPGEQECEQGIPFVGAAGKLLDKILAAINLRREDLYFTNTIICRTNRYNRTPSYGEILNCRERLAEELSIIRPRVSLLVGSPALRTIFGSDYNIMRCHGQWFSMLESPCYYYFAILHPSWILHSVTEGETQARKKVMWEDVKTFRDESALFLNIPEEKNAPKC